MNRPPALPAFKWLVACSAGLLAAAAPAAAQEHFWAVPMPPQTDIWGVQVSPAGGVFVIGSTGGSLAGPSAGGRDAWLARYDHQGERVWVRQLGTASDDFGYAIAPDGDGGIFVCGSAAGDVGGGSGGCWLARYTGDGQRIWIEQFGLAGSSATALAADGAGGCFVAGKMSAAQRWVARFDAGGAEAWMEFVNDDYRPLSLAADGAGGVYQGAGLPFAVASVSLHDDGGGQLWIDQFGSTVGMRTFGPVAVIPESRGGVTAIGWADYHPALGVSTWFAKYTAAGVQAELIQHIPELAFAGTALHGDEVLLAGTMVGRYDLFGQSLWQDGSWASLNRIGRTVSANTPEAFYLASSTTWPGGEFSLHRYGACYANCDEFINQPILNVADFTCFLHHFAAGLPYANCDRSTTPPVLNVADFTCFLQKFAGGCP